MTIWLTTAKGSYIFRKATFQKPKVYCVTGIYELSGVRALMNSSSDIKVDVGVSPEVMAAAISIPMGLQIGPFSDGKSLVATVAISEPRVWAARFHQLDVGYLRRALEGQTSLPEIIQLRPDVTDPGGGLMTGTVTEDEEPDGKELAGSNVRSATVAKLHLLDLVEEMEDDYKDEDGYALAFNVAERKIEADAEASDADDE